MMRPRAVVAWFGVLAFGIAGCKFFLGEPKEPQGHPDAQKPVTIRSFSEASAVSAVQPAGPNLWVGSSTGLQKWDLAKATLIKRFTTADGLPSDRVQAIAPDGRGGVWAMTAGGLVHEDKKLGWVKIPPAPVGAFVTGLVQTDEGLWVGGPEGLAKLQKGAWSRYLGDASVTAMVGVGKDLWIGTGGKGIAHLVGEQVEVFGPEQGCYIDVVRGMIATASGVMAVGEKAGEGPGSGEQRVAFFDGRRFWSFKVDAPKGTVFEWFRRAGDHALIGAGNTMMSLERLTSGENAPSRAMKVSSIVGKMPRLPFVGSAHRDLPLGAPAETVLSPPPAPAPAPVTATPGAPPAPAKPGEPVKPAPPPVPEGPKDDSGELWPAWVLVPWGPTLPDGVTVTGTDVGMLVVGTRFLGASRVEESGLQHYRTFDLADHAERLSVACTSDNDCWVATGTARAWHYDGQSFGTASIDPEPGSKVLAVISPPHGAPIALHAGKTDHLLRLSTVSDGSWSPVGLTQVEVPLGVPSVTFARYAPGGDLWLGLRYVDRDGDKVDFGAAQITVENGVTVYHRKGKDLGPKSKPLPNDIENATFLSASEAWFGTRSGAVHVVGDQLSTYTENDGLESEIIHGVVTGSDGKIWVATSHGVGRFDGVRWLFPPAGDPLRVRATSLARDRVGITFVGSTTGVVLCRPAPPTDSKGPPPDPSKQYELIDEKRGLLDAQVLDLAVDPRGRVWVLTEKGISIVERQTQ